MSTVASATQVVQVSVYVNGGNISCMPDPVTVQAPDTTLQFRLRTPGWTFLAQNAVVVDNPGVEFPTPSQTSADGRTATLADQNTAQASFKYSVFVQSSSGQVISVDPTINNDPD